MSQRFLQSRLTKALVVCFVVFACAGAAWADNMALVSFGCAGQFGQLRWVEKAGQCGLNERPVMWSRLGQGERGPAGPQGPQGPRGEPGTMVESLVFGTDTSHGLPGHGRDCTLGEVILSAGGIINGTPADGRLLPIAANEALFSLLGTYYGGDGIQNFALPDLRKATPNGLTYGICTIGTYPNRD